MTGSITIRLIRRPARAISIIRETQARKMSTAITVLQTLTYADSAQEKDAVEQAGAIALALRLLVFMEKQAVISAAPFKSMSAL